MRKIIAKPLCVLLAVAVMLSAPAYAAQGPVLLSSSFEYYFTFAVKQSTLPTARELVFTGAAMKPTNTGANQLGDGAIKFGKLAFAVNPLQFASSARFFVWPEKLFIPSTWNYLLPATAHLLNADGISYSLGFAVSSSLLLSVDYNQLKLPATQKHGFNAFNPAVGQSEWVSFSSSLTLNTFTTISLSFSVNGAPRGTLNALDGSRANLQFAIKF